MDTEIPLAGIHFPASHRAYTTPRRRGEHLQFCGQCGADVTGAQFCSRCGTPVGRAPSLDALPSSPESGEDRASSEGPELGSFNANQLGTLAYLTCIPALAFLLFEPYNRNRFVRFHSYQCLFLTVAFICLLGVSGAISVFSLLNGVISTIFELVLIAMWVVAMYKAWRGHEFRLPVVGMFAAKHAGMQDGR